MQTKTYRTYEEAAQDYLARFSLLHAAPKAPAGPVMRGAVGLPAEALVEQADALADVSAGMVGLAQGYLDSPDPVAREGISAHLLAQAAAELQVATELLLITEGGEATPKAPVTRGVRGVRHPAIVTLEQTMALPVTAGLAPLAPTRRAVRAVAATPEEAKANLQSAATTTAGAIAQRVCEFGGDVAMNLVFNTQWGAVIEGAGLLGKDIQAKLDAIQEGVGAFVAKAVAVAARTLLNVYDKLMALLGKDLQDQARKQARDWLAKIKQEGKIDVFETLVNKLYGLDGLKKELPGWLAATAVGPEVIGKTADEVTALGAKFTVLVERMTTLENVIGMAKLLKMPQVLAIVAGLQVILLAVLLQLGNDYIGYRETKLLNLTKGVAEVIRESLPATA
jgi:hypothetical protein